MNTACSSIQERPERGEGSLLRTGQIKLSRSRSGLVLPQDMQTKALRELAEIRTGYPFRGGVDRVARTAGAGAQY